MLSQRFARKGETMESKIYTAQELREAAVSPTYVGGVSEVRVKPEVYEMLEQAADIQERCEKVIARCNKAKDMNSPTWTFDKQAFAMDLYEIVNYILRGDAGNDDENK